MITLRQTLRSRGRLVVLTLFVLGVYLALLPQVAPGPSVSVRIPASAAFNRDLEIVLSLHSWSGNAHLVSVRFFPDPLRTTAGRNLYPLVLYQAPQTGSLSYKKVSRLTYPRTQTFRLVVPLAQFARQAIVAPGVINGKIDTEIEVPLFGYANGGLWLGTVPTTVKTRSTPFTLRLLP